MTAAAVPNVAQANHVREAFRRVPSAVAVVTASDRGEVTGTTVNSMTSVCASRPSSSPRINRGSVRLPGALVPESLVKEE